MSSMVQNVLNYTIILSHSTYLAMTENQIAKLVHSDSIRSASLHSTYKKTIMNSNLPKYVNIPVPGILNNSTNEKDIKTVERGRTVNVADTRSEHINVNLSPVKTKSDQGITTRSGRLVKQPNRLNLLALTFLLLGQKKEEKKNLFSQEGRKYEEILYI